MIRNIIEQPWAFLFFVVLLVLLNLGAAIRMRHDRALKRRANINRRRLSRPARDRRWSARK